MLITMIAIIGKILKQIFDTNLGIARRRYGMS